MVAQLNGDKIYDCLRVGGAQNLSGFISRCLADPNLLPPGMPRLVSMRGGWSFDERSFEKAAKTNPGKNSPPINQPPVGKSDIRKAEYRARASST